MELKFAITTALAFDSPGRYEGNAGVIEAEQQRLERQILVGRLGMAEGGHGETAILAGRHQPIEFSAGKALAGGRRCQAPVCCQGRQ